MKKFLFLLLVCGFFACKKDSENPETAQPAAIIEIMAYLSGIDSLSEFAIALKQANISETEAADGLTVFAPGNEAIGAYNPAGKTQGKDLSDSTVRDHIVKGTLKAIDLTDGRTLITLSGKKLTVSYFNGQTYINGIKVTLAGATSGKQIIYTITGMLSDPPGNTTITVWDATQWSPDHRNGLPLAGATVSLYITPMAYLFNKPSYTATTDNNGIAVFTGLAPATYYAVASKGDLSNTWLEAENISFASSDSIFQSYAEIAGSPALPGTLPGDFRIEDLNQDQKIDNNDKGIAPYRKVIITSATSSTEKILVGYPVNHLMRLIKTDDEADTVLLNAAIQVGLIQKKLAMIDGIMSNDADCTGLSSDWCKFDQFTFTTSDATVANIWSDSYAAIQQLNRLILSLPTMEGDTLKTGPIARGLRGLAYLQLYTYFGELPITTQLKMPANISRSSHTDTYNFIKNDLNAALNGNLAATGTEHYMTQYAASALLARAALSNNSYSDAKSYSDMVIDAGVYALVDSSVIFKDPFNAETLYNLPQSFTSPFSQYFERTGIINFCPVIRFAEVLLINAEADLNLGNFEQATTRINQVRNRYALPPLPFLNATTGREALQEIRMKEFYREGSGFATLVRWGLAAQTLSNKGYQQQHSRLPIPQIQLISYPGLYQNVGW